MSSIRVFKAQTIGAGHIIQSIPCQDSVFCEDLPEYKLITVCDGHGGDDYFRSDRGSRFATEAFADCVKEAFCCNEDNADNIESKLINCTSEKEKKEIFQQFFKSLIYRWYAAIEEDVKNNPFCDSEMVRVSDSKKQMFLSGKRTEIAYGTTFIGAVVTKRCWFGIQVGDGDCVVFENDGTALKPIPEDELCEGNITTSLCDEKACFEMRYFFSTDIPVAVFVASDGVGKSFDRDKAMFDLYRDILTNFTKEEESALDELEAYLPRLSEQGSKDDISIAGIMDLEEVRTEMNLFERKKECFLKVLRSGNLGAAKIDDDYCQKARFIVEPDTSVLDLKENFCDGFGCGVHQIEIVSNTMLGLKIKIGDESIVLSESSNIHVYKKEDGGQMDVLLLRIYKR